MRDSFTHICPLTHLRVIKTPSLEMPYHTHTLLLSLMFKCLVFKWRRPLHLLKCCFLRGWDVHRTFYWSLLSQCPGGLSFCLEFVFKLCLPFEPFWFQGFFFFFFFEHESPHFFFFSFHSCSKPNQPEMIMTWKEVAKTLRSVYYTNRANTIRHAII